MNSIIQWFEENSQSSHGVLHSQSVAYAAELCRLGVKRGDQVGVFFDKSASYLAMLLAVWRLNAVVVPLSPKSLRQSRYAKAHRLTKHADPIKLLIHSACTQEEVLLEWMRQCEGFAYPLEYFTDQVIPALESVVVAHYKFIKADDIAVRKIPDHESAEQRDSVLTHGELLQCVKQSDADLQYPGSIALSTIVSNLLSLVTLPIPAMSSAAVLS